MFLCTTHSYVALKIVPVCMHEPKLCILSFATEVCIIAEDHQVDVERCRRKTRCNDDTDCEEDRDHQITICDTINTSKCATSHFCNGTFFFPNGCFLFADKVCYCTEKTNIC